MALPPEKITELKQIIHTQLSQVNIKKNKFLIVYCFVCFAIFFKSIVEMK